MMIHFELHLFELGGKKEEGKIIAKEAGTNAYKNV